MKIVRYNPNKEATDEVNEGKGIEITTNFSDYVSDIALTKEYKKGE